MCNKSCTKNITVHATLMRSMKYTVYILYVEKGSKVVHTAGSGPHVCGTS